jgi:hypothetical protein
MEGGWGGDGDDPPPAPPPPDGGSPPPAPPPPTDPQFIVDYNAYIPQDHISGPAPTGCSLTTGYLYLGDRQGDPMTGGSPYSYRTEQYIMLYPNTGVSVDPSSDTGYTDQFSFGSPANGRYITDADYDGYILDRHLWNNEGKAVFGAEGNHASGSTTPTSRNINVNFNGQASNPLEQTPAGILQPYIKWNLSTTVNNTEGAYTGQVFVSGGVTCYPSHHITVNGTVVAFYTAPQNPSLLTLTYCLTGGPSYPLTGPSTLPGGTPIRAQ